MAFKFRIPKDRIPELALIRSLGPGKLELVLQEFRKLNTLPMTREELRSAVGSVLDSDAVAVDALVQQLLAFNQLLRSKVLNSVEELLEGLRAGVSTVWKEDELKDWRSLEPSLGNLIQANVVRMVSKANELAYEYANLFVSARLVTDIRPVFNDGNGDDLKIDGAVVSHTLRLRFDNHEGDHSLSIALDSQDIHHLLQQCERALCKAQLSKEMMSKQVPTVVSGEDDNGQE